MGCGSSVVAPTEADDLYDAVARGDVSAVMAQLANPMVDLSGRRVAGAGRGLLGALFVGTTHPEAATNLILTLLLQANATSDRAPAERLDVNEMVFDESLQTDVHVAAYIAKKHSWSRLPVAWVAAVLEAPGAAVPAATLLHVLASDWKTEEAPAWRALVHLSDAEAERLVTALVRAGADPAHRDPVLGSPLFHACLWAALSCVRALLAAGAKPDKQESVAFRGRECPLSEAYGRAFFLRGSASSALSEDHLSRLVAATRADFEPVIDHCVAGGRVGGRVLSEQFSSGDGATPDTDAVPPLSPAPSLGPPSVGGGSGPRTAASLLSPSPSASPSPSTHSHSHSASRSANTPLSIATALSIINAYAPSTIYAPSANASLSSFSRRHHPLGGGRAAQQPSAAELARWEADGPRIAADVAADVLSRVDPVLLPRDVVSRVDAALRAAILDDADSCVMLCGSDGANGLSALRAMLVATFPRIPEGSEADAGRRAESAQAVFQGLIRAHYDGARVRARMTVARSTPSAARKPLQQPPELALPAPLASVPTT